MIEAVDEPNLTMPLGNVKLSKVISKPSLLSNISSLIIEILNEALVSPAGIITLYGPGI